MKRDPRLTLTMVRAALSQQHVAQELGERPVWDRHLKTLRALRLDHMEEIVRNRDADVSYERGVCDALALMITYNSYDERTIQSLKKQEEGLLRTIESLQDADLLPPQGDSE